MKPVSESMKKADEHYEVGPPKRQREAARYDDAATRPAVVQENPAAALSMAAVVRAESWRVPPDFSLPWRRKKEQSEFCSAVVIGERRLITNAHAVEHSVRIWIKKRGCTTEFSASVLAIATELDLALLTCDADDFWKGITPVEFEKSLPALQDDVSVLGYPIGGDSISVTQGVVSRIGISRYVHSSEKLLALQIDATINVGNCGGPVFNDKGKCVGIVFQIIQFGNLGKVGQIIPTPIIMPFIDDYDKSGQYRGLPVLPIKWQEMVNTDLREAMEMPRDRINDRKGVRVVRVEPTAPRSEYLEPSDVIVSLDGIDVASDGTVPLLHGERIGFSYLVSQKHTGDKLAVKVLRKSVVHEFDITLATSKRLIPHHINGKPAYYIVAGFVFTAVSVPYLQSEFGQDYKHQAPVQLLEKHLRANAQTIDEVVIVSQVILADVNLDYKNIAKLQVISFNGKQIKNLKHLVIMVESCEDRFLQFHFCDQKIVVLNRETAKAATGGILEAHSVPAAISDDLKTHN